MARRRDRDSCARGGTGDRVSRRCARRPRRSADAGDDRPRALLRRVGRHAARAPRAIRQPREQGVEPRAAQALLPPVQLRAPGRGDRGRPAALARSAAFVSARRRLPLSASGDDEGHPRPGVSRRAGIPDALALERDDLARGSAHPRRQESAAAAAADARRRPDGRLLSRRGRVPREHPRRPADSRSSAREPDRARLPPRGDGLRRAGGDPRAHSRGRHPLRRARHDRAVAALARDPERAAVRLHGRCAARGAAHAGRLHAPRDRSVERGRSRRARRRRDRARPRRGASRSARRRRAARRAAHRRIPHR